MERRAWPLWLALIGLSVLTVLLLVQNAALRRVVSRQDARLLERATQGGLVPGDRVGALALFDASGAERGLFFDEGGPATVVFVVSAGCAACDLVLPAWDGMVADDLGGALAVVIDVAAGEPGALEPKSAVIQWRGARRAGWLRGVPVTPSVIVVRGGGEVVGVWSGNVAARRVDEIRDAARQASLPG